jgi:hypothetical protein
VSPSVSASCCILSRATLQLDLVADPEAFERETDHLRHQHVEQDQIWQCSASDLDRLRAACGEDGNRGRGG